jgi:DNA-binding CsgD family transcriptional regulator
METAKINDPSQPFFASMIHSVADFDVEKNTAKGTAQLPAPQNVLPLPPPHKQKRGNHTGERLHPPVYRKVVELLAQGVSANQISRKLRVSRHTIRAVKAREAVPIAQRKKELAVSAARVAQMAIEQIEDEVAEGNIRGMQLVPTFGVMVDKVIALDEQSGSGIPIDIRVDPVEKARAEAFWRRCEQRREQWEREKAQSLPDSSESQSASTSAQ